MENPFGGPWQPAPTPSYQSTNDFLANMTNQGVGDQIPFFELSSDGGGSSEESYLHDMGLAVSPETNRLLNLDGSLPQIEPFQSVKQEPDGQSPVFVAPGYSPGGPSGFEAKMSVVLTHKPRGQRGVWMPVESNGRIRVTKGKGKRLRVEVRCNFRIEWHDVHLRLYDCIAGSNAPNEEFAIDSKKSSLSDDAIEAVIELTLTKLSKKLQFIVTLHTATGLHMEGKSVTFTAHNNGKDRNQGTSSAMHTAPYNTSRDPLHQGNSSSGASTPNTPPQSGPSGPYLPLLPPDSSIKKRRVDDPSGPAPSLPPVGPRGEEITTIPGSLHVNGEVRAHKFAQFSDIRLKTNVEDLVNALDVVKKLQGKSYQWKKRVETHGVQPIEQVKEEGDAEEPEDEREKSAKRVIGFIAQQVEEVLPEVVTKDPVTGYLSVSYADMVALVVAALNEHRREYENSNEKFQKELAEIRSALDRVTLAQAAHQDKRAAKALAREERRRYKEENKEKKKQERKCRRHKHGKREKHQCKRHQEGGVDREYLRFQHELLKDPLKQQRFVANLQLKILRDAMRYNSKIACVIAWDKGHLDNLTLHVTRDQVPLNTFILASKQYKHRAWVAVGLMGGASPDNYHGHYRVVVDIHGGYAYQLQRSRTVFAAFDFRLASTPPIYMSCDPINGDIGHHWLVGSFDVGKNVFQWRQKTCTVVASLPADWDPSKNNNLSRSAPVTAQSPAANKPTVPLANSDPPVSADPTEDIPFAPRRVYLKSKGGRYLTALNAEGEVQCLVVESVKDPGFGAAWDMEFAAGGILTLRSSYGKYLTATPEGRLSASTTHEVDMAKSAQFKYVLDDMQRSLVLISPYGAYVHATPEGSLVASSARIEEPLRDADSEDDSQDEDGIDDDDDDDEESDDAEETNPEAEAELYRTMGEGAKSLLEQSSNPPASTSTELKPPRADQRPLKVSSDSAFYQTLRPNPAPTPASTSSESSEGVNMGALVIRPVKQEQPEKEDLIEEESDEEDSSTGSDEPDEEDEEAAARPNSAIRMPREGEIWKMEVAPSREAHHALQAEDIFKEVSRSRFVMNLSGAFKAS